MVILLCPKEVYVADVSGFMRNDNTKLFLRPVIRGLIRKYEAEAVALVSEGWKVVVEKAEDIMMPPSVNPTRIETILVLAEWTDSTFCTQTIAIQRNEENGSIVLVENDKELISGTYEKDSWNGTMGQFFKEV